MDYKYKGKTYDLRLNQDGKIECVEMGIVADTVDQVKDLIRQEMIVEKAAPKINVLFWTGDEPKQVCEGKTTGAVDRFQRVYVSWKNENGRNCREPKFFDAVYTDTPANRETMKKIIALQEKQFELQRQESELDDALVNFLG